jgi:hypothetical protein
LNNLRKNDRMKTLLTIAISLTFATTAVRAQTLSAYQSIINGQSPTYYNTLDNTTALVPTVGTGTFTASGAGYGSDLWGNANDAVSFSALANYLTGSGSIISGAGAANGVGSLSLLFYLPSTVPNTAYLFSDTDTGTTSMFAFDISGGNTWQLKLGNTTKSLTGAPAITANTWYYLGLTYDRTGVVAGVNGVNWYLGALGGTLSSGFIQNGGSGNISATSTLGDGGAFILGNRRAFNNTMGINSEVDELATWNTQLSSTLIQAQFAAVTVPEPSTCAVLGLSGLLVLWKRRAFRA